MLLSNAIVAILALSAIATPSSGLVLSNTGLFHRKYSILIFIHICLFCQYSTQSFSSIV